MSKLYVVCGLSGSGKTTLAKRLSKKLNIVCLHKDSIKSAIFDIVGSLTPEAIHILFRFAEEQISNGVDLMIEAPMNFEDNVPILEKWQKEYNVDTISIVCQADTETRKKRITERDRHECHKEADVKILENIESASFDFSVLPGKKIFVNTDSPLQEVINQIIAAIKR